MQKTHRPQKMSTQTTPPVTGSTEVGQSNSQTTSNVTASSGVQETPFLDAVGKGEPEKKPSTSTGPLDSVLGKVGKVAYNDPAYGGRDFGKDEYKDLVSGSDDMKVASCSPLTYWALENADKKANPDREGSLIQQELDGNTSIKEIANVQSSTLEDVKNLKGGDATLEDLVYGKVAEEDQWRGKGVAGAIAKAELGSEVGISEAKPGDFCHTWKPEGSGASFKPRGHSTQVHRVHAHGAAWFGVDGAPLLESVSTGSRTLNALVFFNLCDESGSVLKQPDAPVWIEDCTFRIDEKTSAAEVGEHTVMSHELVGAHLEGKNSEGETVKNGGVYTKQAEDLSTQHNDKEGAGAMRVHLARLNESQWADAVAATSSNHSSILDIEKIEMPDIKPIPVERIDELHEITLTPEQEEALEKYNRSLEKYQKKQDKKNKKNKKK